MNRCRSRLVPTSGGHVWSSQNLYGFSMAPFQSTWNQRNTTAPCFVALQAPNCGAGPSANKHPTQPTKNLAASWKKMWQLPKALLVKYVTQSHVHLNSLHNKNSQVLIFHSHESQPLKGNVTSSSAMEDDLNHRNSTGFQIFFQGVPTLAARRRGGELVANLDACLLCGQKHECCYVVLHKEHLCII